VGANEELTRMYRLRVATPRSRKKWRQRGRRAGDSTAEIKTVSATGSMTPIPSLSDLLPPPTGMIGFCIARGLRRRGGTWLSWCRLKE